MASHRLNARTGLKDVTYPAGLAQALGADDALGASVRTVFATAVWAGRGRDYVPSLTAFVAAASGTSLTSP